MLVRLASLRPLYNESWYWLADVTCVIKATLKEANANCRRRISSKCMKASLKVQPLLSLMYMTAR